MWSHSDLHDLCRTESVAAELEAAHDVPAGSHQLVHNGEVLSASRSLASYGIDSSAVLDLVPLEGPGSSTTGSPPLSSPEHGLFANWQVSSRLLWCFEPQVAFEVQKMGAKSLVGIISTHELHAPIALQAAQKGLAAGLRPLLAASGSGGSYFMSNAAGDKVAVLKPADEEPYGANNPRSLSLGCSPDGSGLRKASRATLAARTVVAQCITGTYLSPLWSYLHNVPAICLAFDLLSNTDESIGRATTGHSAGRGRHTRGRCLRVRPRALCRGAADGAGHLPQPPAAGQ